MDWKKILKRVLLGILVAYVGLVIYRIPAVAEKQRTEEAVARIHAQKLTLDTVMGKYLPEAPDPMANDATVEGIDRNNNGIRDDVELAIFKKYPNSAKNRAAELQYAMSLQMELTEVFNTETLIATIQEEGRGTSCIDETIPSVVPKFKNSAEASEWLEANKDNPKINAEWGQEIRIGMEREKGVEDMVFNTPLRKEKREKIYKYMASFSSLNEIDCDVNLSSLPN